MTIAPFWELCALLGLVWVVSMTGAAAQETFTRAQLADRIRGGWTGTLIGGIEGLPHEFQYNEEPRAELPEFSMLPDGARTDDDNDFEWTHLYYIIPVQNSFWFSSVQGIGQGSSRVEWSVAETPKRPTKDPCHAV